MAKLYHLVTCHASVSSLAWLGCYQECQIAAAPMQTSSVHTRMNTGFLIETTYAFIENTGLLLIFRMSMGRSFGLRKAFVHQAGTTGSLTPTVSCRLTAAKTAEMLLMVGLPWCDRMRCLKPYR
jgi:hypothetical protein